MRRTVVQVALLLVCGCASTPSGPDAPPGSGPIATQASATEARSNGLSSSVRGYRGRIKIELLENGGFRRSIEERYELGEAPPEDFQLVMAHFDPVEDDRPELSASVTLPDGTVSRLDPSTIDEFAADDAPGEELNSRRFVTAPLPTPVAGAVVERRVVTQTARPRLQVGHLFIQHMAMQVPVDEVTLVLEHSSTQQVQWAAELTPEREERGGRVRLTWTQTQVPGLEYAPWLPPEERRFPAVWISTASTWNDAVRGYLAAMGTKTTSSAITALARRLEPRSRSTHDIAMAALEWMHQNLRSTTKDQYFVSVIPDHPEETLRRGFGEDRDLAAFLVALLEASGVSARMVLVDAEDQLPVGEGLPGLNHFNHTAVMILGATPLWIDPSMLGLTPGTLPEPAQDRVALVIDPATTGTIRTPVGEASSSRLTAHTDITLPIHGASDLKRTMTATGLAAPLLRFAAEGFASEAVMDAVTAYHQSTDISVRQADPLAMDPFELTIAIRNAKSSYTFDKEVRANVGLGELGLIIPQGLLDEEDGARAAPLFVGHPRQLESITRIRVPPHFALREEPSTREGAVGQFRWSHRVERREDGAEVRTTLTFGSRVIPAEEVQRARNELNKAIEVPPVMFDNVSDRLLAEGKYTAAVEGLRRIEAAQPGDPLALSLLSRAAMRVGLVEESMRLAREANARAPSLPPALRTLSWALGHAPDGQQYGPGALRRESLSVMRRAHEVDPGESPYKLEIELTARNDAGVFAGEGADVEGAIELLAQTGWKEDKGLGTLYAKLLWESGRDRDLLALRGLPDTEESSALQLAARTRHEGGEVALARLRTLPPESRDGILRRTVHLLFRARRHSEAQHLATALPTSESAELGALIRKAVRRPEGPRDPANSVHALMEGHAEALGLQPAPGKSPGALSEGWRERLAKRMERARRDFPGAEAALLDVLHGSMEVTSLPLPGVGVLLDVQDHFGRELYVFARNGSGHVLHPQAADEASQTSAAWDAVHRRDFEAVRGWLEVRLRTYALHGSAKDADPVRSIMRGSPDDLVLALAFVTRPDQKHHLELGLQSLESAWKARGRPRSRAQWVAPSLPQFLNKLGRHAEALAVLREVRELGLAPPGPSVELLHARLLADAGRTEEAVRLIQPLLDDPRTREHAYRRLELSARARRDLGNYRELLLAQAGAGINRLHNLGLAARTAVHLGSVGEVELRQAEEAVGPEGNLVEGLKALALVHAERGEADKAVASMDRIRGHLPVTSPLSLYIRGRIAETLGFERAARSLYGQIPEHEGKGFNVDALAPLARKRLQAMTAHAR